jgi:phosphoglycolate phosphatase
MQSRPAVKCARCGSLERTRVLKLLMDKLGLPKPGQRMLHLAPEKALAPHLRSILADGYDPVDVDPGRYRWEKVRRLDLVHDAANLPSLSYDIVLHSHVMEHIPCNVTAVLFHLHRALKEDGFHVFSIPILNGRTYAADFGKLSPDKARHEFGQHDHVRRFGSEDIERTLGMIFPLSESYDIEATFGADVLTEANVPEYARSGWTPHTVLAMRKHDFLLSF